jgi:DNA-binding IclR family transcriptional regulator
LLSSRLLDLAQVTDWFGDFPLEQKTPHTLITPEALLAELQATRVRGYGIDDEENELGINCVAVPVYLEGSATPSGAVSVSAVRFRCPVERLVDGVPVIREAILERLGPGALG